MSEDPGAYIPPSDLGECQKEIYQLRAELARLREGLTDLADKVFIESKNLERHDQYAEALEHVETKIKALLNSGDGDGRT